MMDRKLSLFIFLLMPALCLNIVVPGIAEAGDGQITKPGSMSPDNTVILSNEIDARFSRDFSVLLKHLRLEWVVLDSATVPDSILDKNVVLIGHPDSEYSGQVIHGILTAEEVERLRAATDQHIVLEIESPWMGDRTVTVCSGVDMLQRRNAADEAIRAIIANAPPVSDWIRTTYDAELDENVRDYVKQLQYEWEEAELPLQDLTMDVGAKPRRSITAQQAAEDVDRLFYILSHGYSGYAFFNQDGKFEQARAEILDELSSQSSWSSDSFSELLHNHLGFIGDGHLAIGDYKFAVHHDFWYDTQLELTLGYNGYQFAIEDTTYTVLSINNDDPTTFIVPSLNQQGEPIYRVGLLSTDEPSPLRLDAESKAGERTFEIELQRSDFAHYSDDIFREDVLGGIPVVRARSFGDYYADELSQFVDTASNLRGEPVVVLDIRGNGGGNEHWPISWIQRLTGRRAESVFVFSELKSKTSMVGRANAFRYWYQEQDMSSYGDEVERFTKITEAFERGASQPHWTGPLYPQVPLIANDTTVIVVTNEYVASAGEGLVLRISQAENVVVVGENTMGALTFGNISTHQLPHSNLMIWMPINFGLFLDQEFREGRGLAPDLWVPAADAVNYAVAAVRNGTITSAQPLSSDILEQDFTPENPYARDKQEQILSLLVVAGFTVGGLAFAYFNRKKPRIVTGVGGVWIVFGSVWSVMEKQPVGLGLLLVGVICLVWGGINLLKARQAHLETSD